MNGRIRRISILVASFAIVATANAESALAELDLPAQALGKSLQAIATATHVNVLFDTAEIAVFKAPAIRGRISLTEAMGQVLGGTGLTYRFLDENTLVLVKEGGETPAPAAFTSPAASMRLAQAGPDTGLPLALSQASSSAAAQDQGAAPENEVQEVVVRGRYELLSVDTSGATNLPLPIEKVPQSISLVSGDFIKAADLKTLGKIAEYTPGAVNVGTHGGYATMVSLRGFGYSSAIDGVQMGFHAEPEYAIVDRLEFVKGPSSVVYGVSGPGGVVNFVTKSASLQTPDYLTFQAGMWNSFRLEGQLAGALDSAGRTRGIGVVVRDQGDSFMNQMSHEVTTLYGRVERDLSDSVSALLYGVYGHNVRTGFDGIPTYPDGAPAPLPRSFFIGSKNMELDTSTWLAGGDLTWHATDMLELSLKGRFLRDRTSGVTPFAYGLDFHGNIGLVVEHIPDNWGDRYAVDVSGIYRLDSAGFAGSFMSLSATYNSSAGAGQSSYGLFDGEEFATANIFDGEAAITALLESNVRSDIF